MKHRLRKIISNPILLILPIVFALAYGWQRYTFAGLELSIPQPKSNIMPNGDFAQMSGKLPTGWQVTSNSNVTAIVSYSKGYVAGRTMRLNVAGYQTGDITLSSPRVAVRPDQVYLYKGYYKSTTQVSLLARYFYADGTNKLQYLQDYRDSSGDWSTVSDAFGSSKNIIGVQYLYRLTSNGQLEVNGVYLEPGQSLYLTPQVTGGQNLLPNRQLNLSKDLNMPDQWSPYQAGSNAAAFAYIPGPDAYLGVTVHNFKDGEAKWQHPLIPVAAYHNYQYTAAYQSDVPVDLVAESVLQDGQRTFNTLATLSPASDWTYVKYSYEASPDSSSVLITPELRQNGSLRLRPDSLTDITKTGKTHWNRPLVSISFDDGWQSAYTNAVPLLRQYGYQSTFYINAASINTSGFLSSAELEKLSRSGNEVAAHGFAEDDLTAVKASALLYQLRQGRDYLRQAGFSVTDFATPFGSSDAEVQYYARQLYSTNRGTVPGINTYQSFDPYNLKILYVDATTEKSDVANALSQAKRFNGWLILVYHRVAPDRSAITPGKAEVTTVTTQAFNAQMELVKQSHIAVLPISKADEEVSKQ